MILILVLRAKKRRVVVRGETEPWDQINPRFTLVSHMICILLCRSSVAVVLEEVWYCGKACFANVLKCTVFRAETSKPKACMTQVAILLPT